MKTIYEQIKLIAHRGLSSRYCENTYPAFFNACEKDFYGIECDIQFTADNKIVCFHDKTLRRLTGEPTILTTLKYRELKNKKLTIRRIKGEYRICLFKKYLKLCKKYNKKSIIEIKGNPSPQQLDKLLRLIERKRKLYNYIIISFNSRVLKYIRQKNEKIRLQLLSRHPLRSRHIDFCKTYNVNISFMKQLATHDIIKKYNSNNIEVSVWVVNTKPEAQTFINNGVEHITSNFLL